MAVSPLTIMELVGPLVANDPRAAQEAFETLKLLCAMAREGRLLPRTNEMLRCIATQGMPPRVGHAEERLVTDIISSVSQATSVTELRPRFREFKDALDDQRRRVAQMMEASAQGIRKTGIPSPSEFRYEFAQAVMARADVRQIEMTSLFAMFGAYFEARTSLLMTAARDRKINFYKRSNINNVWDAEQLVYLSYPGLHLVTADDGFERITAQRDQINYFPEPQFTPAIYPLLEKITLS